MGSDPGLQVAGAIFTVAATILVFWILFEPLATVKADKRWSLGSLFKLVIYWFVVYGLYKGWWYLLEIMEA